MKKQATLGLILGLMAVNISCKKEGPAKNIQGNYTGTLSGVYDDQETLVGSYPVFATVTTTNKVKIEGSLFPDFEVLVTQQGINVIPVSTDKEVVEFLYQGKLKELSFKYYKNGDSTNYVGTKP